MRARTVPCASRMSVVGVCRMLNRRGQVGPVGEVEVDVARRRPLAPRGRRARGRVARHGAQTSVENCSRVARAAERDARRMSHASRGRVVCGRAPAAPARRARARSRRRRGRTSTRTTSGGHGDTLAARASAANVTDCDRRECYAADRSAHAVGYREGRACRYREPAAPLTPRSSSAPTSPSSSCAPAPATPTCCSPRASRPRASRPSSRAQDARPRRIAQPRASSTTSCATATARRSSTTR